MSRKQNKMGLSIMAAALEKFGQQDDTEAGKLASKVISSLKREKTSNSKLGDYYRELKRAITSGYRGYYPCSDLQWKAGKAVKVHGVTGRIRCVLINKEGERLALVNFDSPFKIKDRQRAVKKAAVPVSELEECDCRGYRHTRGCKPQ